MAGISKMDRERWQVVQELFHAASELPVGAQREYVELQSAGDPGLVATVMEMLGWDRDGFPLDAGEPAVSRIGPYRILRKIGEGGMGVVYLGEREEWHSLAAIKVPRDAWISNDRLERFAKEQKLLAQLTHPSIARIYDGGTLRGSTPWFAMEYVEGETVTVFCEWRKLGAKSRLELFLFACEAVAYAHTLNIVHRDIKPSNILVTSAGDVKLLDFGIAKQMEEADGSAWRTRVGQQPLTLAYAAPEQVLSQEVDKQADVYSLGVVLYEMLTGDVPFHFFGLTAAQTEELARSGSAKKPSALVAGSAERSSLLRTSRNAWQDLDVLVLTAMHKDRRKRYVSAHALMKDVQNFLNGDALAARADNTRYRLRKFVERRRVPVFTAAALVLLIAALISVFTLRLARSRDAALTEAARARRMQDFMVSLFEAGDQDYGPSKEMKVVDLLENALRKAHALDRDPRAQSDVYNTLGSIYGQFGDAGKSDSLLHTALKMRQGSYGSNSSEVAEVLVEIGLLQSDQAHYREAEKSVREGLGILRKQLPETHGTVAKYKTALGNILFSKGDYRGALLVLEEARRVQSKNPELLDDLGATLDLISSVHIDMGDYAKAEEFTRQAIAIDLRTRGENYVGTGADLANLGNIQYHLRQYAASEASLRKVLAIDKAWYPPGHPETADMMRLLAQTLVEENRLRESFDLVQAALPEMERAYGTEHPRVAYALMLRGRIAMKQGALLKARADLSRAVSLLRTGNNSHLSTALCNLGAVYALGGEYPDAAKAFREAIETRGISALAKATAQLGLGDALLHEKQYRDAEPALLSAYRVLSKQPNASPEELNTARSDLAALYGALYGALHGALTTLRQ